MRDRFAAQLEWLRSDERLRERVRATAALSPEERLRMAHDLARIAAEMLARQSPEARVRLEASRERPGPDAEAALRRLGRGGS